MFGVSIADFWFWVERFVGHRFDFIQRRPDTRWYLQRGRPLTDWLLIQHLAGDYVVGTGCRYDSERKALRTPYVVVDLDRDDDDEALAAGSAEAQADHAAKDADLRVRYQRVVHALGMPSYVIQSSASRGLHVYYLLNQPEDLHALRSRDGRHGDVSRLLAACGLPEERGRVEVYPRGQYRDRGPQARLRLPFGTGSALLDAETLELLAPAGAASLSAAHGLFNAGEVRVVDPLEWHRAVKATPAKCEAESEPGGADDPRRPARHPGTKRVARRGPTPTGHDPDKVRAYLTDGLKGPRQLNAAASALAYHFRFVERLDEQTAAARMVEWLDERHNGMSRTYRASPKRARNEVTAVVARVYAGRGPRANDAGGRWAPLPGLTADEVSSILRAFEPEYYVCDPKTGVALDRYKLQRFAFELLRRAKQYVLTAIGSEMWSRADGSASNGLNVDAASRIGAVWPDRARPEFIVVCPASLRDGRGRSGGDFLRGIGRDARWALWRAVLHARIFEGVVLGSKQARRAATYRVRLDLSAPESNAVTFDDFNMAVAALVPLKVRRRLYSRYRCALIRTAEARRLAPDHAAESVDSERDSNGVDGVRNEALDERASAAAAVRHRSLRKLRYEPALSRSLIPAVRATSEMNTADEASIGSPDIQPVRAKIGGRE